MSTDSAFSVESLFVELVAHRLRSLNRTPRMSDASAFELFDADLDTFSLYNDIPTSSVEVVRRLSNLERAVSSMAADMKTILKQLTPVDVGQVRGRGPEVVASSKLPCSSSSSSPSASPKGFQFVCPLCLKGQLTPKSHCEHLKHTVDDGVHVCRFIQEHSRHDKILKSFSSAEQFVSWYCSHLRSGMGSKFTATDIADYTQLQQNLDDILHGRRTFVQAD
jgi:hypothetical protein